MSALTRIRRRTYATPRKAPAGRMTHQSTHYAWMPINPLIPMAGTRFVRVAKGNTYRRKA